MDHNFGSGCGLLDDSLLGSWLLNDEFAHGALDHGQVLWLILNGFSHYKRIAGYFRKRRDPLAKLLQRRSATRR